nr:MAG TPA: hypothetical protein [Caudoviricetes sp.]
MQQKIINNNKFPSPIFNDSVRGIFLQLCVCQDIKNVL